jgi:hypothetical protein
MDNHTPERIARELRFLKVYAVCSSVVLVALLASAFAPSNQVQELIRARRIELVNDDGRYALVLAGKGKLPGPVFGGKEYPQALSGGRTTGTGMIFFNGRGDEVGGLTYHGETAGDRYSAGGGIMFDQFDQDQVVGLQYSDNGTRRSAGLNVWDRTTQVKISSIIDMIDARSRATGAARDSIQRALAAIPGMDRSAHRVFLGSDNRTATLLMRDVAGRPRIRMYVDSMNVARLEFLDEAGQVVNAFPR